MKKISSLLFLFLFIPSSSFAQMRALGIYPLNSKLSYRSNAQKNIFFDTKASISFSTIPYLIAELNLNKRWVKNNLVNFYTGGGLTLDSYVPGLQVPIGIEIFPFTEVPQFSVAAEANPKLTFGPSSFLNTTILGNLGILYYFRK
jgi:hypothetical protein